MRDGGLFRTGRHPQRAQEVVHEDVQLLHVLGFGFQHAEDNLVPLPHAVSMRGADVILDDGLPLPSAEPTPEKTLDLFSERRFQITACQMQAQILPWICYPAVRSFHGKSCFQSLEIIFGFGTLTSPKSCIIFIDFFGAIYGSAMVNAPLSEPYLSLYR